MSLYGYVVYFINLAVNENVFPLFFFSVILEEV